MALARPQDYSVVCSIEMIEQVLGTMETVAYLASKLVILLGNLIGMTTKSAWQLTLLGGMGC